MRKKRSACGQGAFLSHLRENNGRSGVNIWRKFVKRIEKLNEDTAAIAADIKEIYSEAKSAGFDPKYIRQMIRLRKLDPDELDEADELTQMYRNALGI